MTPKEIKEAIRECEEKISLIEGKMKSENDHANFTKRCQKCNGWIVRLDSLRYQLLKSQGRFNVNDCETCRFQNTNKYTQCEFHNDAKPCKWWKEKR